MPDNFCLAWTRVLYRSSLGEGKTLGETIDYGEDIVFLSVVDSKHTFAELWLSTIQLDLELHWWPVTSLGPEPRQVPAAHAETEQEQYTQLAVCPVRGHVQWGWGVPLHLTCNLFVMYWGVSVKNIHVLLPRNTLISVKTWDLTWHPLLSHHFHTRQEPLWSLVQGVSALASCVVQTLSHIHTNTLLSTLWWRRQASPWRPIVGGDGLDTSTQDRNWEMEEEK